jgi:ubiquinone/menaquinone biosynthesis C-methylase UbiE
VVDSDNKNATMPPLDEAVAIQRRYYTETATKYDAMHADEAGNDSRVMKIICSLVQMVQPHTLLEVGSGTGSGISYLRERIPSLSVFGVEPVQALIEQAVLSAKVPQGITLQGIGEALAFGDASVDVVCSFGILHHMREPNRVVREMLRVARKAVIIADSNRFGQGKWPIRFAKLALYKAGLWRLVNYVKTGGKGYMITEGDGLAYSYSIYDSFEYLATSTSRLIVTSAGAGDADSWFYPLLTSGGIIIAALKEVD